MPSPVQEFLYFNSNIRIFPGGERISSLISEDAGPEELEAIAVAVHSLVGSRLLSAV